MENIENVVFVTPKAKRKSVRFARNDNSAEVIIKIHNFLKDLKHDLTTYRHHHLLAKHDLINIKSKTAELCSVSRATVGRVLSGNKENQHDFKQSNSSKTKHECDPFCISMIRRVTQEFYHQKTYPTAKKILNKCLENRNFPKVSLTLFKLWLKDKCKFKYRKINKKPVFLERKDILVQRENYLRSIRTHRQNGYEIFYSDETWASPDQARNRCWQMLLSDSDHAELKDVFSGQILRDMNGWTGGFLLKSGAGRVIINHIGSQNGFLEGGADVFICSKDSKDYHSSMNYVRYEEWFKKILKILPNKSVVVVDQAPYHKKRVPSTIMPNMSWRKQQIIDWLILHQISLPSGIRSFSEKTKPSLLELSKTKPIKTKYCIEQLAEDSGKDLKVLWLPPAHCEFNPIELVWAKVKGYVAEKNKGSNVAEILKLCNEGLNTVTPDLWKACVQHVLKYEKIMWERDKLMDDLPFQANTACPLIIPLVDNDTTSDSSSSPDSDYESDATD